MKDLPKVPMWWLVWGSNLLLCGLTTEPPCPKDGGHWLLFRFCTSDRSNCDCSLTFVSGNPRANKQRVSGVSDLPVSKCSKLGCPEIASLDLQRPSYLRMLRIMSSISFTHSFPPKFNAALLFDLAHNFKLPLRDSNNFISRILYRYSNRLHWLLLKCVDDWDNCDAMTIPQSPLVTIFVFTLLVTYFFSCCKLLRCVLSM